MLLCLFFKVYRIVCNTLEFCYVLNGSSYILHGFSTDDFGMVFIHIYLPTNTFRHVVHRRTYYIACRILWHVTGYNLMSNISLTIAVTVCPVNTGL